MNTVKFEKGQVAVVAHRGLSGIEKENTIAAFVAAGNRSYFGIETDIYRTADGHFVISHDRNLDGLAGVDMDVENTTLAEIQKVVLYDTDGATKRIDLHPCTLEDYVRICKKYDKQCVLELKSAFTLEETEKFISIINEIGYLDRVTFISFNYDNLLKVRQILPSHHVQYLFCEATDELVERAVMSKMDIDVEYTSITPEVVKRVHDAGLKVNCWTVNDKSAAEVLAAMGVDYITTNILE